jgi:(p)ppGpp synthase/HD superfamily hydrolase
MEINLNPTKHYQLEDVMKKRKKNLDAIEVKIKSKAETLLRRKKNKADIPKRPEKFVKAHRAAQKSFASLKNRVYLLLFRQ